MAVPRPEQLSPVQADPVLSAKVNPIPDGRDGPAAAADSGHCRKLCSD